MNHKIFSTGSCQFSEFISAAGQKTKVLEGTGEGSGCSGVKSSQVEAFLQVVSSEHFPGGASIEACHTFLLAVSGVTSVSGVTGETFWYRKSFNFPPAHRKTSRSPVI